MTEKTDYEILGENKEPTPHDLLKKHLAALPQDLATADLIGALFDRYVNQGRPWDFYLRAFDERRDPHGLLVGFNEAIAVFWRSSCGHFWFYRKDISFQHPAAFIEGSDAPIIDAPQIGTCYRFQKGQTITLAIPMTPCALANEYQNHLHDMYVRRLLAGKGKADGDDDGPTHRPGDGFTLLGGDKS